MIWAIVAALAQCTGSEDERLHAVQARLRCGTQCGSCLPALRALVRQTAATAAATGALA